MKTKKLLDVIVKILIVFSCAIVLFLTITTILYRFPTDTTDSFFYSNPLILFFSIITIVVSVFFGKILRRIKQKFVSADWII